MQNSNTPSLFQSASPIVATRAVHLDLKGCPPTASRLVSLLKVFKAARYNAVVVEWEDMFPWTVDERFRNETAYTPQEVRHFCHAAEELGLEIIPMVQCLGHMETVLSVPGYEPFREVADRVDVLNVLARGARALIERMVDDVLSLMPTLQRMHLGGDEAWTFGSHPQTKAYIAEHGAGALYLHHVGPILQKLKARNIRPMLWHDMMVEWSGDALRSLATQADLVVWGYAGHPDRTHSHFKTANIERLKSHGLTLWGAGAYKGADGHNVDVPDPQRRQENALAWAEMAGRFGFSGLIATAWSRYSTHMTQNEPIDAALDTLFLLGVIFHDGAVPPGGISAAAAALESIGEGKRFLACRDAMHHLTEVRRAGWCEVANLHEQLITSAQDPRRRASQPAGAFMIKLRALVEHSAIVGAEVRKAFAGLMPAIWIERYLAERLEPLREELEWARKRIDDDGFGGV